ncbi:hypothetical protein ASC89_20715 [Devosia sp. Root413D1]|uniref:hypothetical protein n=1 Tax=Devosia sp. Root413D1 TaxID=1736531 RepID=UPI0006FAEF8B|nr:hypothetical protein [Devosia sp. Root413D1]KQW77593.1 hypothetical protein ASC89_20715 [Devosia sp. Root413D1]
MFSIVARVVLRVLSIVASAWLLVVAPVEAQSLRHGTTVRLLENNGEMQNGQLYAIDVSCSPKGAKVPADPTVFESTGVFSRTYYTASHLLIITLKDVADTPSLTQLPTDALVVVHPYTSAKDTGWRDSDCKRTVVVAGGPNIHLVIASAFSATTEPSPVVGVITGALKLASPLLALFGATPEAAAVTTFTAGIESLKKPYQDLLSTLNEGTKIRAGSATLVAGTYEISAPFSTETVTVRPVASLVQDGKYAFTKYLDDQIGSAKFTLNKASFSDTCLTINRELYDLGMHAPLDLGYAKLQLALRAKFTKSEILQCLTREQAIELLSKLPERFWGNVDVLTQRYTLPEVDTVHPVDEAAPGAQPPFDKVKRSLFDLVSSLSAAGRTGTVAAHQRAVLATLFADSVLVSDRTSDELAGGGDRSLSRDALVDSLASSKIRRFGCYAATVKLAALDTVGDGAVAAFLGFVVDPNAVTAAESQAVVFGPFFGPNGIEKVTIMRDFAMISAIVTDAANKCGELSITNPP